MKIQTSNSKKPVRFDIKQNIGIKSKVLTVL